MTKVLLRISKFQSTLPVRGATSPRPGGAQGHDHFNPRSPCGERRDAALRRGIITLFQSTLPVRGATALPDLLMEAVFISIHAPRAGSDSSFLLPKRAHLPISIHAPRAGSDSSFLLPKRAHLPISIHAPRAGSDACIWSNNIGRNISIHAPRAGSDCMRCQITPNYTTFQSTLPVRGATRRA